MAGGKNGKIYPAKALRRKVKMKENELEQRGLKVQRQAPIAIEYAGIQFKEEFRDVS